MFGSTVSAFAAASPDHDSLTVGNGSGVTLTVQFDGPVTTATANKVRTEFASQAASPGVSSNAGPKGQDIYCNQLYSFGDSDGTFTLQHKCGGKTSPWGYIFTRGLCVSLGVSDVIEEGMRWYRNGTRQGNQAPHPAPGEPLYGCGYQYHGNFNPDYDDDSISYSDEFLFAIEVDGEVGHADLTIDGSFRSLGCENRIACGP
jgi:hypothetical protein